MSGSLSHDREDIQTIHNKIRALNAAPTPDTLENAEALFDTLEKVAGIKRHRIVLVFWGGYTAGLLCCLMAWLLLG